MNLRNHLNIILSIIFTFILICFSVISCTMEHQQAREEILQTAKLLLEMSLSIRRYTIEEISPLIKSNISNQNAPQRIPSYAAIKTFTHLKQRLDKYEYKESLLNPKNPINRATEWEVDLIRKFRNQSDLKIIIGNRKTKTDDFLYLAVPVQLNDKECLVCHGVQSDAPTEILTQYGDNGFGWKIGEIIGSRIITVPASLAKQKARKSVITLLISIICVFALIILAVNLILKNTVVKPIFNISNIAEQISFGKKTIDEFPKIKVFEFKKLIEAIKRLKTSRDYTLNLLNQCSGKSTESVQFNMQEIISEPDLSRTQSESEIEML